MFHEMQNSGSTLLYCDNMELHLQDSGFYIFCVLYRCQLFSHFALVNGKLKNAKKLR